MLDEINSWMDQNFLQLNNSKSEIVLLGPPNSISRIENSLGPLSNNIQSTARNLSVTFDSDLQNFHHHLNKVVKSRFL